MYLSEPKLVDIVKRQFRFKLNAHAAAFTTFVILQIGAFFLAFSGSKHTWQDSVADVTLINLSNDVNVGLSFIWAFILGIMLTTALRRNEAFSFVTTRLSNQLANLLFMLTASIFAGLITVLTGPVLKLLGILRHGEMIIYTPGLFEAPLDMIMRFITAASYILLFFLIGYTISSLVQLNKIFIGFFIALYIAFSFVGTSWDGTQYVVATINFFSNEHFLPLFLLKVFVTVLGLFAISAFITNRLEVRH